MNKIYEFELIEGQKYDSNNNKILLLHPSLLRENIEKLRYKYFNAKDSEELIIVKNMFNKFAVFDKKGNMIVNYIYDEITSYHEDLARFKLNNKWGFIDRSGNIIVDAIYDYVYDYNEGYARVVKNNNYGLIRKDGKIAVDCTLDNITDVVRGICIINNKTDVNLIEKGAIIAGNGINFLGSNYYYQNRKENKLLQMKNTKNKEEKIMQVIKKLTDKFFEIPLVYNMENDTLIIVTKWEEKDIKEVKMKKMN